MPAPRQTSASRDRREDLTLLEETVRRAGHIARKFYGGDYKKWNKEGGSPVTEADLAVNQYLCDVLTAARPDYGWLSEENPDDPARLSRREVFVDRSDRRHHRLSQEPSALYHLRRHRGGRASLLRRGL